MAMYCYQFLLLHGHRVSNEKCGEHYNFVTTKEFQKMIDDGDFFEHACVHGDWKGTAYQSIGPHLEAGRDVLLEIDWQGARQVRQKITDTVSAFILPPSSHTLKKRMLRRGQDSSETIACRLAASCTEMLHFDEFDYLIINDDFDTSVDQMCAVLKAGRLRCKVQAERHPELLRHLLRRTV